MIKAKDIVKVAGVVGRWYVQKIEQNSIDDRTTLDVFCTPASTNAADVAMAKPGVWFNLEGCTLIERDGFSIPTVDELAKALLEYQETMHGGCEFIWLVLHPSHPWTLKTDRRDLEGVYTRTTIGKGDAPSGARMAAEMMIDRVVRYLDHRGEIWSSS